MKAFRALAATLCAPIVALLLAGPAMAQLIPDGAYDANGVRKQTNPFVQISKDSVSGLPCVVGFSDTCLAGVAGGGGGGTATPFSPTSNTTLAASTSSSNVALPGANPTAVITNLGPDVGFIKLGTSNAVTAASTDTRWPVGVACPVSVGANTYMAAITSSGTANFAITTGSGASGCYNVFDTGPQSIKGPTAEGSTPSDPPLYNGCKVATTLPTQRADTQVVANMCGKDGRQVFSPFGTRELTGQSGLISLTTTTETTLISAGASLVFNDLTWIRLCNTNASTDADIDVRDATGGTIRDTWHVAAGRCTGIAYPSPFNQTTAANNWTVKAQVAVSTVTVTAGYVQRK